MDMRALQGVASAFGPPAPAARWQQLSLWTQTWCSDGGLFGHRAKLRLGNYVSSTGNTNHKSLTRNRLLVGLVQAPAGRQGGLQTDGRVGSGLPRQPVKAVLLIICTNIN